MGRVLRRGKVAGKRHPAITFAWQRNAWSESRANERGALCNGSATGCAIRAGIWPIRASSKWPF
jgi:hypothetical protein